MDDKLIYCLAWLHNGMCKQLPVRPGEVLRYEDLTMPCNTCKYESECYPEGKGVVGKLDQRPIKAYSVDMVKYLYDIGITEFRPGVIPD